MNAQARDTVHRCRLRIHRPRRRLYLSPPAIATMDETIRSLPSLDVMELAGVARRNNELQAAVDAELNARFMDILTRFFENPVGFRGVMDDTDSVISGSSVIPLLTGHCEWRGNDLDVYTTFGQFDTVKQYLIRREGFHEAWSATRIAPVQPVVGPAQAEGQNNAMTLGYPRPVETGIYRVACLMKGDWKVDVIQSRSGSPLYAIPCFWSTLQMNFVSARGK